MIFVPYEKLQQSHIHMLEKSLATAPLYERPSLEEILKRLSLREAYLFEIPYGILIAEIHIGGGERRLTLPAFYCSRMGAHARRIIADVKRLASDWNCDNIETCCYGRAMLRLVSFAGAEVESINMVLRLEKSDGKQDNNKAEPKLNAN